MRRLPVVMFVAAIAIWGLASIPDGSGNNKTSLAYRRGEVAKMSNGAFLAPAQKAAALRAARFDSRGAAAGRRMIAGDALGPGAVQVDE
jgi:hypothetical protein